MSSGSPEAYSSSFVAVASGGHEGQVVVSVQGELDVWTSNTLDAVLEGQGSTSITLDLGGVSFIDGAGYRCVLDAMARRGIVLVNESAALVRLRGLVVDVSPAAATASKDPCAP